MSGGNYFDCDEHAYISWLNMYMKCTNSTCIRVFSNCSGCFWLNMFLTGQK